MKLRRRRETRGGFDWRLYARLPTSDQYAGKMIKVRGGFVKLRVEDLLHDSHSEPCPA